MLIRYLMEGNYDSLGEFFAGVGMLGDCVKPVEVDGRAFVGFCCGCKNLILEGDDFRYLRGGYYCVSPDCFSSVHDVLDGTKDDADVNEIDWR